MRVGIVSIFDDKNFGNRLQNYALQEKIMQYCDYVISIKNKHMLVSALGNIKRRSPLSDSPFILFLLKKTKRSCLAYFTKKYIQTTRKCYWDNRPGVNVEKCDSCDIYCAGSDQVWNPNYQRHTSFNYLGFAPTERTFSYAASFGVDSIPEEYQDAVRKGLNHIKYISVREDAGKRIVEELTGRTDVQVLVDPTMLLTTQEWDKVTSAPKRKLPEKYILTYFLGTVPEERKQAIEAKAAELGCEIIETMDPQSPFYAIGPGEFVYLIKHAALVCTDSFHGSVFSFLYGRPLAIFDRKGSGEDMSSRLRTLASKFRLEACMADGEKLPVLPPVPDYSAGYAALEEERAKSKAFLDMVFQEAERAGLCN